MKNVALINVSVCLRVRRSKEESLEFGGKGAVEPPLLTGSRKIGSHGFD